VASGTPPATVEQVFEDLSRRIRSLERSAGKIGPWRLTVDGQGNLIARNSETGTTTTIAATD
jgi:hypothetical protein